MTARPWSGVVAWTNIRVYRNGSVYFQYAPGDRLGSLRGPLDTGGWRAWSDYEAEPDAPFRTRREALEWLLVAWKHYKRSQQEERTA